ncbi:MAG: GNAT family N-acetyltransferase [Christensenellales bacterium]
MILRRYIPSDCEQLIKLFFETVHTVNAGDYNEEQLNAWATGREDAREWNESLSSHYTVVCVEDDVIAGFGDIDENGYLDRLFVGKDYQRRGIATAVCDELEGVARDSKITVHSSVTAKPFFVRRGYAEIAKRSAVRNGVFLPYYVMEKERREQRNGKTVIP